MDPGAVGGVADRMGHAMATAIAPDLGDAHRNLVVRRAGDAPVRDALARVEYLFSRHTMADTERALAFIERARATDPDHPGLLSALATVRYRFGEGPEVERLARTSLVVLLNYLGRGAEAVHHMESALALDPVSATLAPDAGVVFLWAGRYEGAERHCGAAIELAPEARAARRCLVRVASLRGRSEVGVEPAVWLLETDGPGSVDGSASDVLRRYLGLGPGSDR